MHDTTSYAEYFIVVEKSYSLYAYMHKMHIISYSKSLVMGSSRALTPQWFFHMIWLRLTSTICKNGELVFRFATYFSVPFKIDAKEDNW